MKKLLIFILLFVLVPAGPVFAAETPVPILLYHNVTFGYCLQDTSLHITPDEFEEQIVSLKNNGYNIISLQHYINHVNSDETLPEKPVIITFDDGYLGVYKHAYPILQKHNVPATVFIITGLVGFNDTSFPHFDWNQAKEMEESDVIDIQSHTRFHYNAKEISLPLLTLELRKSKYDIESRLGKTCNILAFPYGEYNREGLDAAIAAGYTCVARTEDMGTNRKSEGLFHLNRIFVRRTWSGADLINIIEQNNQLYLSH